MQSRKGVTLLQPDRTYSNWIGPSAFCLCSWLPSVCISFYSGRATSALHCYIPVPSFTSGYLTQPQNSCHGSKKLRHQFRVTSCALSRCHKRVVNLNVFRCLHYLFCIAPVVGNCDQFFSLANAYWENSFSAEQSLCPAKDSKCLRHHVPFWGGGRRGSLRIIGIQNHSPQSNLIRWERVGMFILGLVSSFSFTGFLQQSLGLN